MSNSAGTSRHIREAEIIEETTGVKVFRHSTKKPGCGNDVYNYFKSNPELGITKPNEVAVVGDRLFTDIMMANMMGALGVWVRDGVLEDDRPVGEIGVGRFPCCAESCLVCTN